MADGDDEDRRGAPDEAPLESWGDLGELSPGRATRSWSQIAALDEHGRPRAADDERPVEGLLTVDSGLLDIMAKEQEAGRASAAGSTVGSTLEAAPPSALPDDFDLDDPAGGDSAGVLPDDFDFDLDDSVGGALPDDFDPDTVALGGALPDDFDAVFDDPELDDSGTLAPEPGSAPGALSGALPDDIPLDDILREDAPLDGDPFDPGGALPDDIDLEDALLGAEADGGALPDDLDFDLDDLEPPADTLGPPVDPGSIGALPDTLGTDLDGALPDDFDLDGVIGEELADLDGLDTIGALDDLADPDGLAGLEGLGFDDGSLDGELDDDGLIGSQAPDDLPALDADALAIGFDTDLDLELDEPLDDFDLDPDLAIGAGGEDWLDEVLDQVEGRPVDDEGWGALLEDDEGAEPDGAPAADGAPTRAGAVDGDLWAAAAARWGEEPGAPPPAEMPFDDPFAAPVRGGLEDETGALGDPFARFDEAPSGRRVTAEQPPVKPRAPADPEATVATLDGDLPQDTRPGRAPEEAPSEPPPSGPTAPTADQVADAWALLARRSAERRQEHIADADDPEVMVVEELLEDGDERRVVRVEYPRLGELEILELPEDGGELPGLDDDFAPFSEGYVFFEEDALEAGAPDRRSTLAALSREPVELARMLAPGEGPVAPQAARADDSTDVALSRALDAATRDSVDLSPPDDHGAMDDDAPVDPVPEALSLPPPESDGPLPLADLRPAWAGSEVDLAGAFDPEMVEQLGAPFIGVVPRFTGRSAVGPFPPGSLARSRVAAPDGPAVLPRLRIALPEQPTWAHRLACFLIDEASTEPERARLATLLHGLAVVARRPLEDERTALEALRAAVENDPGLALSRWSLHALLDEVGLYDELIDRLVHGLPPAGRPDAAGHARHRAGHVALGALGDAEQALWQWGRASTERAHPASRLARYLLQVRRAADAEALAELDGLLEAAEGPIWWSALALERVRLGARMMDAGHRALDPRWAEALLEEAVRRRGGVPAVFAAIERHALARGRMSLWLSALRARFDQVMAEYDGGTLGEGLVQQSLASIFVKAGLALEALGRRTEALAEYQNALTSAPDDPYALHRAVELARRLGEHEALRRHLDRLAKVSHTAGERADAAYQMGLVAQQILGDDAAAEADFRRALAAMPTMTPALAALGRLDLRRGRLDAIQDRYADEIRELEAALRLPQSAAERRRTITAAVDRYYRLARLLEETGDAPVALDVYKRALAVDPRFLPAFEAMDRLYVRHGRWRERTALILGWVQRQQGAPMDAVGPLLTAADGLRVHLDDLENAGRIAARTLALAPDHPYAVRRASETFARLGNTAARIEVDLRWGRLEGDPRAPARLLRAAQLQELDGDPLAAAAEALPLYREALARDPESVGAVDGLLRTALRLGRTGEIVHQIETHDLAAHPSPVLALPMAEALLAAGRPDEAAELLIRWRARARAAQTLDRAADAGSLALLALACERTDHWRMLADTLEEQAALAGDRRRAVLLARAGALWELRLEEPALAADAYRRALEADPDCAAAKAGAARLAAVERGDWRPAGPAADALARAREADARPEGTPGRAADRAAALDAVAAGADEPRTAIAWRALARGEATTTEAAAALYAAHPERGDLFARYRRRLEAAGETAGLIAALWLRLDYEDEPGRTALLTSIIGHGLRIGDAASVTEAAETLLEMDPRSLPALLALRRLGRQGGDPSASAEAGRKLTGALRAPGPAAEVHHAAALEAEAGGAAPDRVRRLLTHAIELNPADDTAARALADRLQAAGEWTRLADLHRRRLSAIADPERRRPVARDLARLLADRFDDLPGAWTALRRELVAEGPDAETALLAAGIAERLGRTKDADTCFALAARAEDGRMRLPAMRAQAVARQQRGDRAGARALIEKVLRVEPRDAAALELLAELLAADRQWKGVVQVFQRLMTLETAPAARADRAMAIGEIFARVYHDPRRAAGWFKRAVELDPARLDAVWRLLEEADAAPEGAVPAEHVGDAVDRAIEARRAALAERCDRGTLDALARLHARRGDRDGQLLVGEALAWLGLADTRTRRWVAAAHKRVSLDFARPLGDALRRELLEDPAERGRDRVVFDAFALVLTEVLSGAMPGGVARLSRRSFPEWQAEFRRLAAGLGVEDVELHNGGRAVVRFRGLYLPRPAIAVPQAALAGALDARQAFVVGQLLDGLRDGRLLLEVPGVERVQRCAGVMGATLSPGLLPDPGPDAVPTELRARLAERARRLPRRLKLQLDGLAARGGGPVDFTRLARGIAATRDRAGLLACGDLRVALDRIVFPDAAAADAARRAGGVAAALDASPAGRALLSWALGADHARLRRVLGLGLSGRVG